VWCTGVIYHSPNPVILLQRFEERCGDVLVLGSLTLPEVPGVPHALVFFPGLTDGERNPYRKLWGEGALGLAQPFDGRPDQALANCWFGPTPSALAAMLESSGFEVLELHTRDPSDAHVVARRAH
jgi:hypothetical protein